MSGKTYGDLCNEVLVELFYELPSSFEELTQLTEGIKVKQDLNSALTTICNNQNQAWKFREVSIDLSMVPNVQNYSYPDGYIKYLKYRDVPIVLTYMEEYKYLPRDSFGMALNYWFEKGDINFFPIPDQSQLGRLIECVMYTNNFAYDACGVLQPLMVNECDTPIIPAHHRDILKWKVCADWRGSLNDAKAAYYEKKYKNAYASLMSDQKLTGDYPAGFNIMPITNTAQNAILDAFYNPRVRRIV